MADDTLSTTARLPYEATVTAVREQLAKADFGVTEIDLTATLEKKALTPVGGRN